MVNVGVVYITADVNEARTSDNNIRRIREKAVWSRGPCFNGPCFNGPYIKDKLTCTLSNRFKFRV